MLASHPAIVCSGRWVDFLLGLEEQWTGIRLVGPLGVAIDEIQINKCDGQPPAFGKSPAQPAVGCSQIKQWYAFGQQTAEDGLYWIDPELYLKSKQTPPDPFLGNFVSSS